MKTTGPATAQWTVVALLVVSVSINYIDRGNLSVAAVPLSRELRLDPAQVGLLLSAFFWTYASFQIAAGWLIGRYSVMWIYAVGYFIWSTATTCTGLIASFPVLFALRLALGAGESVAYPCYSRIIAGGIAERHRGFANALIDAGSKTGPAIGLLLCGTLVGRFGWRMMFVAVGAISMLWLLPWSAASIRLKIVQPIERRDVPGVLRILRVRSVWGTFIGLFCANYAWYFLITWLPWYLVRERHYSTAAMAVYGSLPFWGVAASSLVGGWVSDALIVRGASPTLVRKTFVVSGLALGTLMFPACLIKDQAVSLALLVIALTCYGMFSSNCWVITQTIAGPAAAGEWTGLQNAVGNVAGVVAPLVTGWVVGETGKFFYAFLVVSIVLLAGAASYLFLVGKVAPMAWGCPRGAGDGCKQESV